MKKIVLSLITAGLFVGVMAKDVNSQYVEKKNLTSQEEVVHYDNREINQTEQRVEKTDKKPLRKKVIERKVRELDDKK